MKIRKAWEWRVGQVAQEAEWALAGSGGGAGAALGTLAEGAQVDKNLTLNT
jgi:hypothetical protein